MTLVERTAAQEYEMSIKKITKNKQKRNSKFFVFTFLILPIINFIVFYFYVNIDSFVMAFQKEVWSNTSGETELIFTLENFNEVYQLFVSGSSSSNLGIALRNTIIFYLVGIVIILPLTILTCYFLSKKIRGYKFFRAVFYFPCIVTATALVVLFKFALGDGGILDVIQGSNYAYPLTQNGKALLTILFYTISFGIGGNIIIIGGAMNSIDHQLFEAGELDGCNWFQELIYIIIPSIWPALSTILILSVASFLGSTGPILPFTKGAYETTTLAYYIFSLVAGGAIGAQQNLYLASAIGLIMTAVSFPLAMFVKRIVYGRNE